MTTIDTCFELPENARTTMIDEIASKISEEKRGEARERAKKIVSDYIGRDVDAISVLAYAAERGRFDEFAAKLETHYKESLHYVHPEARRIAEIPGAVRAEIFFLACYEALGIKPHQN